MLMLVGVGWLSLSSLRTLIGSEGPVIAALLAGEGALLQGRQRADGESATRAYTWIWIGMILGAAFMLAAAALIAAELVRRQRAEQALHASDTRLRAMFNAMLSGM